MQFQVLIQKTSNNFKGLFFATHGRSLTDCVGDVTAFVIQNK